MGTLTAVDLFLAALLGLSNSSYKKTGTDGTLFVDQTDESKDIVRMQFNIDPVDMATKKTVTLSVDNSQKLSSTSSPQE